MTEILPFDETGKRYHTYDRYLKETFGTKCVRIPLDAGFSCPNREGGKTGCTFCSSRGSASVLCPLPGMNAGEDRLDAAVRAIREQARVQYAVLCEKWGKGRLPAIPYFQAYTGTYAPPAFLSALYHAALSLYDENGEPIPVVSVAVATRPDCVGEDVIAVLSSLAEKIPVTVELGLQSVHNKTLEKIRRGHTAECFFDAYERLTHAGLPVCVHLINGLPGENAEDMLESARRVSRLNPAFVKIHMLHILRGTALGDNYEKEPFPLLTREEYVDITCRQIELLPRETVLCRLTGDGYGKDLLAPDWTRNKRAVLNAFDRWFSENDSVQGINVKKF